MVSIERLRYGKQSVVLLPTPQQLNDDHSCLAEELCQEAKACKAVCTFLFVAFSMKGEDVVNSVILHCQQASAKI